MTRIIPAIDLIDGKCVRLEKGDYTKKKIYHSDPLDVAKSFEDAGIQYLHLVDLDGAKAGKVVNAKVLEKIAHKTRLYVDFGGGIKSKTDLELAFNSGAKQVNIGSLAVKDPELFASWIERYGGEKIILSADVKDKLIAIHGWQTTTDLHLYDFLNNYLSEGIETVVCTDIAKDGMMQGPSIELYKEMQQHFPQMKLIASGGVTTIDDVDQLIDNQVFGIIIGKAIYEGTISLEELSRR